MIYTTYFANLKKLDRLISCPISICRKAPYGYRGLVYKKLAPSHWLLRHWHEKHDEDFYTKYFYDNVLSILNPKDVMEDFRNLINIDIKRAPLWWENVPFDIYLVCYERSESFCHRHLVAEWMNNNGIYVKEF